MKIREGYYSEQIRDATFRDVAYKLNHWQAEVLAVIKLNQPISNEQIAVKLERAVHTITPRVLELRQMELVEFDGKGKTLSGKKCSMWRIKESQLTLSLN